MTDWKALARARRFDIPEDAVERNEAALTGLEESFRPLLAKLRDEIEPAVALSESAVEGR